MSSSKATASTAPHEGLIDLVQIKWQQIRESEFQQKIQQENIDLKLEIRKLEKDLKELASRPTVTAPTSAISARTSAAIDRILTEFRTETDRDLQEVRLLVTESMTTILSMQATFFLCNKRFQGLFEQSEVTVMQLRREKQQLQQTILDLKREISDFNLLHSNDLNSLESRCEILSKENNDQKVRIQRLVEENERLQKELSQMQSEKDQLRETFQAAKEMNDRLESEMKLLQTTTERLLQESSQTQQQLIQHYEGMIEQMAVDNQFLKNHIQDLEDQIARLSQSLIGNKSHFAKYVEVKTENIALQSKLNSIMKQPKASFNAGALPQLATQGNQLIPDASGRKQSLIAQDLVELTALTRSEKQPPAMKETIPSIPLPRLNPRHSLDNGILSHNSSGVANKTISSQSARESFVPSSGSPRSGGDGNDASNGRKKVVPSSANLLNSSSVQAALPRRESNAATVASSNSSKFLEKKKSLRIQPSAESVANKTDLDAGRLQSQQSHHNKLIV